MRPARGQRSRLGVAVSLLPLLVLVVRSLATPATSQPSGVALVTTEKQLADAIADPAISTAQLTGNLRLQGLGWPPGLITRTSNFTVKGNESWPILDLSFLNSHIFLQPGVTFTFAQAERGSWMIWTQGNTDSLVVHVELRNTRQLSGFEVDIFSASPGATVLFYDIVFFCFSCLPPKLVMTLMMTAPEYPGQLPRVMTINGTQWCRTQAPIAACYNRDNIYIGSGSSILPPSGLEGIQSGGGYVLAGIEVRFVCASPVTDECGSSQGYDFCVRNTIQELYEKDQTWQLLAAADAAQGPQQQGGGRSDKANTPLIAGLVAGLGGGVLLVALVGAALWVWRRKQRSGRDKAAGAAAGVEVPPGPDPAKSSSNCKASLGVILSSNADQGAHGSVVGSIGPTLCLDLEAARAPGSAYKTASEAVPGAGPLQGTAGAAGKVEEGPQSQSAGGERTPARTGSTSISSMTCSSGCNREHGSGQGVGTRVGSGAARGVAAAALQEVHAQQDGQQGSVETSAPDGPALVTVAGITLDLKSTLGCGSFGKVFKGSWGGRPVAVKVLQYGAELTRAVHNEVVLSQSLRHPNVVSSLHFAQVLSGGGPGGQSAELAAAPGAISAQVNRLAPATPAAVLCPRGSQRAAANVYSRFIMDDSDLPHVPGASNLADSYLNWNQAPGSDGASACGDEEREAHGDAMHGGAQAVGMEPLPGTCCSGPLPLYLMEGTSGLQGSSDATVGRCSSAPNAACSLISGLPQGVIAGEISESGGGRAKGSVRAGAVVRPQRVGGRRDGDASTMKGLLPGVGLHRSGGGAGRASAGQAGAAQGAMQALQGPCNAAAPPGLVQQRLVLHPLAVRQPPAAVSTSALLPQAVAVDPQRTPSAGAGPTSSEPRSVISLAIWRATPEGGITQVAATGPAAAMGPQPGAHAAAGKAPDGHGQEVGMGAGQRPFGLAGGNAEQGVPLETLWLAANAQPAEGSSHGFLVMELCEGGSLFAWRSVQWRNVGEVPDMAVLVRMALGIARGMAYIHSQGVCHGDLKLSNCLLARAPTRPQQQQQQHAQPQGSQGPAAGAGAEALPELPVDDDGSDSLAGWVPKVCDFGLSRVLSAGRTHVSTRPYGTPTHMAPELWTKGHVSPQADVYAYGITLWELATGERPYRGLNAARILHRVMLSGGRPVLPLWLSPAYTRLVGACWAQSPKDRPDFPAIVRHLETLLGMVRCGMVDGGVVGHAGRS